MNYKDQLKELIQEIAEAHGPPDPNTELYQLLQSLVDTHQLQTDELTKIIEFGLKDLSYLRQSVLYESLKNIFNYGDTETIRNLEAYFNAAFYRARKGKVDKKALLLAHYFLKIIKDLKELKKRRTE